MITWIRKFKAIWNLWKFRNNYRWL